MQPLPLGPSVRAGSASASVRQFPEFCRIAPSQADQAQELAAAAPVGAELTRSGERSAWSPSRTRAALAPGGGRKVSHRRDTFPDAIWRGFGRLMSCYGMGRSGRQDRAAQIGWRRLLPWARR